ncbi:MAG: class I SAM-dependent methyltransferase [Candidatus Wildermuthbacteria bacterium]|nr:class I SAM-dependent methyltransferase [Candidatus Wildermuthbacteria bacterium]
MRNYDTVNPEVYERRFLDIPRERYLDHHWLPRFIRAIENYCDARKVLDLGCGTGRYTQIIEKFAKEVTGVDISERFLQYARETYGLPHLICGDAHHLSLDDTFDVVTTFGLFEYIDRDRVMREIDRVLIPGGYLIVATVNKYGFGRMLRRLRRSILQKKPQVMEPSKGEMLTHFKRHHFEIIEVQMTDGLIWLPDFLDRMMGEQIYMLIEKIFHFIGTNPLSNTMLFIAKKQNATN